jgi:hypothetical protein
MKKLLLTIIPLLFFSCETIKEYQASSYASEARAVILNISSASKMYYQAKGEWPGDVEQLERAGQLDLDRSTKLKWTFELQLPYRLSATSTEEMKGGAGYEVVYDVDTEKFSFNRPKNNAANKNKSSSSFETNTKNKSSSNYETKKQINSYEAKSLAEEYIDRSSLLHGHMGLDYYSQFSNPSSGVFTFYGAVCYGSSSYDCKYESAYIITKDYGKTWSLDF